MGISGYHLEHSLFTTVTLGPDWVSGGAFGVEAVATVLIIGLIVWVWRTKRVRPATQLSEMWARYPKGYGQPTRGASLTGWRMAKSYISLIS